MLDDYPTRTSESGALLPAAKVRTLPRDQLLDLNAEGLRDRHDVAERGVRWAIKSRIASFKPLVSGAADPGAVSDVVLVEAALYADALDIDAEGYGEAIPIPGRSPLCHVLSVSGLVINGAPYMVLSGADIGSAALQRAGHRYPLPDLAPRSRGSVP